MTDHVDECESCSEQCILTDEHDIHLCSTHSEQPTGATPPPAPATPNPLAGVLKKYEARRIVVEKRRAKEKIRLMKIKAAADEAGVAPVYW